MATHKRKCSHFGMWRRSQWNRSHHCPKSSLT